MIGLQDVLSDGVRRGCNDTVIAAMSEDLDTMVFNVMWTGVHNISIEVNRAISRELKVLNEDRWVK